jgi:hypothetical protein
VKIKKFRIKPRLPSVGKVLKGLLGVSKLTPDIEASLPMEVQDFLPHLLPAAFYQSWAQEDIPPSFRDTLEKSGHKNALTVTAMVATVGQSVEEYLSELLIKGETTRAQVVTALSEESTELAFQFLYKLLIDDARHDDCEISEPVFLSEPGLIAETLTLLEAEQEGVTIDAASHLTPRFTRVAIIAWRPIARKKRSQVPEKKRSA